VPCALLHFTPEEAAATQLPHFQHQLAAGRERLAATYASLPAEALCGADWDTFQWAHSVGDLAVPGVTW
jgi:hypothetical protein